MWSDKNRQMSIKVAQKWFHQKNEWLPNILGDLGKIIVVTGFEWLPKVQKIADDLNSADNMPTWDLNLGLLDGSRRWIDSTIIGRDVQVHLTEK